MQPQIRRFNIITLRPHWAQFIISQGFIQSETPTRAQLLILKNYYIKEALLSVKQKIYIILCKRKSVFLTRRPILSRKWCSRSLVCMLQARKSARHYNAFTPILTIRRTNTTTRLIVWHFIRASSSTQTNGSTAQLCLFADKCSHSTKDCYFDTKRCGQQWPLFFFSLCVL